MVRVVLVLLAGSGAAQAQGDCRSLADWEKAPGRVELAYRITDACEVDDLKVLVSQPPGAFDEAASCLLKIEPKPYITDETFSSGVLTQEQVEAELRKYRSEHPDRYYSKSADLIFTDGTVKRLTCYLDVDHKPTSAELSTQEQVGGKVKVQPFRNFASLPVQHRKFTFVEGDSSLQTERRIVTDFDNDPKRVVE